MTSRVAALSAGAIPSGVTLTTRTCALSPIAPPLSAEATRVPSSLPVASMTTTRPTFAAWLARLIRQIWPNVMAPNSSGANSVLTTKKRDTTRSRYSRLTIAQSLAMSAHPRLDPRRADPFQEDLVQRGLHELEARDVHSSGDEPAQQLLRRRAGRELDLEVAVLVVHPTDERAVGERRLQRRRGGRAGRTVRRTDG